LAYDLTGKALRPLGELVELGQFPLAEYIPADSLSSQFGSLYYTDAYTYLAGDNFVINAWLAWKGELKLEFPGSDTFELVLGSAGTGWTAVHAELVIGPDLSMALRDVTLGLRVSEDVLKDVATGDRAEIEISCEVRLSAAGLVPGFVAAVLTI